MADSSAGYDLRLAGRAQLAAAQAGSYPCWLAPEHVRRCFAVIGTRLRDLDNMFDLYTFLGNDHLSGMHDLCMTCACLICPNPLMLDDLGPRADLQAMRDVHLRSMSQPTDV